jgi:hypothetical protein
MFLSVIDDLGERCLLRLVHSKELLEPALHHLTVAADKKPSRIDGAIRPPMFTKCLCSEIARIHVCFAAHRNNPNVRVRAHTLQQVSIRIARFQRAEHRGVKMLPGRTNVIFRNTVSGITRRIATQQFV